MSVNQQVLSSELETALLRQLQLTYDWENHVRFRDRLAAPVIALSDAATRFGRWIRSTRTLELSRALVLNRPWPEVVSVLDHEMAHQFVDEVLGVHEETAHGSTFQQVCADRGIDARASGPPASSVDSLEGDRILDRIRKLLALAGSPNQYEAEIAMRHAHELMLRHNIDNAGPNRGYELRLLGDPGKRTTQMQSEILCLLAESFFVKAIRIPVYLPTSGKHGTMFEISGTRPNVEMAAHVYAFLLATAERLWRENRGDARVRSGRDRIAYQSGVIRGFRDKLRAERVELRGAGLVWVGDAHLDAFYRARHPRTTTHRSNVRVNAAHAAGCEAGRTIILHKPVEHGSGNSRRLLTGAND